jgi:hypothetical protein
MKGIIIEHQSSFCVANTLVARFVYRFFPTKLMILLKVGYTVVARFMYCLLC